jgi:hypothetical protein
MMTIQRVEALASVLRDAIEVSAAAHPKSRADLLAHAAIALSISEWEELRAQPNFFMHVDPLDGVVMFHGIRIASRTKLTVKA